MKYFSFPAAVVTMVAVLAGQPAAFSAGPVVTDPEQAGIDFQVQGEYEGTITVGGQAEKWGAQIIALGGGKFDLIGYQGGLPGAGWKRGDETTRFSGQLNDAGVASFATPNGTVEVAEGELRLMMNGQAVATLKKQQRTSPTLGEQPPADAIVLFDGSSTDAWENGKLVDGQWLGATNAFTKEKLGDHQLHVEFRTPYMPEHRGQARGNSGVYLQGRYELQVLDSFALDGKNNECGGIYTIAEPIVNMCLPPLAWQTYDIDFKAAQWDGDTKVKNARVTIRHNGVLIHEDLELPGGTPGFKPEVAGPESLMLQNHNDPVVFRNIWVVKK